MEQKASVFTNKLKKISKVYPGSQAYQ